VLKRQANVFNRKIIKHNAQVVFHALEQLDRSNIEVNRLAPPSKVTSLLFTSSQINSAFPSLD
jgi:hypothetical protein